MLNRKIGLEFEFPAINLSDGKMIDRSQIKKVWDELGKNFDYQTYYDPATKQPVGVLYKDEDGRIVIVDTDVSVGLVEFGFNPFYTLHDCYENMVKILKNFLPYFHNNGIGLLSTTFHPKTPNFYPDLKTEKVWYRVLLKHLNHYLGSNYAAHQVCIDVSYEELMPLTNSLLALSSIFIALFANSSVGENKIFQNHDEREYRWDFWPSNHPNRLQLPSRKFASFTEYLKYNFEVPFVAVKRPNSFCIVEDEVSNFEYLVKDNWKAFDVIDTEYKFLEPTINDVNEMNQYIFLKTRIKYFFKKQSSLSDLLKNYKENTFDDFAKVNLEKLYLENRSIDAQNWDEIMAPSAFILGLIENLPQTKKVVDSQPWEYWLELRKRTIKSSLEVEEAVLISQELLEISKQGLVKRNMGEEVYLDSIARNLKDQKSPAMKAIEEYQDRGIDGYIKNRLINL
ncbi:MAG: hypothetical protein F6K45_08860 [Kamptonema sp. SIO1D9]|nr:hypothetical protein [Kamptonema sp. SIO1D9]